MQRVMNARYAIKVIFLLYKWQFILAGSLSSLSGRDRLWSAPAVSKGRAFIIMTGHGVFIKNAIVSADHTTITITLVIDPMTQLFQLLVICMWSDSHISTEQYYKY